MHANKYKNTIHEQQIDQYIPSRDVFIWKLDSFE